MSVSVGVPHTILYVRCSHVHIHRHTHSHMVFVDAAAAVGGDCVAFVGERACVLKCCFVFACTAAVVVCFLLLFCVDGPVAFLLLDSLIKRSMNAHARECEA